MLSKSEGKKEVIFDHSTTLRIREYNSATIVIKVRDFAMALRVRKVSGAFEKRVPGPIS